MASTLNCTQGPNRLSADADIVGPGVLAAFFTTATVTILAVIFAYLTNSLDESLMNDLDRKIIFRARRKWRHLKRVRTNLANPSDDEPDAIRQARKEAITQFILALSDQQLVTGLAILIAGASDPAHLSGYEFGVILGLAWFSSTTHLATLTALRKYMDNHGVVRDVRVVGMLLVLVLLIYSSIVGTSAAGSNLPMLCQFESGLSGSTVTVPSMEDELSDVALIVALIMVVFLMVSGYASRIQEQYCNQRSAAYFPMLLVWRFLHHDPGRISFGEHFADRVAEQRLTKLRRISESTGRKQLWLQSTYQYSTSFLCTVPDVGFSFAYGITQVIWYRWSVAPVLTIDSNRMGFGQIMTMLLLFLPALAAGEAYYDYRNRRTEKHPRSKGQADDVPTPNGSVPTSDLQEISGLSQDIAAAAERFDKDMLSIEVYLPSQVRSQIRNGPKINDTEMLRRKYALLVEYEIIRQFERQFETGPAILLFTVASSIQIALGVLLNASNNLYSLIGTVLFFMYCAPRMVAVLQTAIEAMRPRDTKKSGDAASINPTHFEASYTASRRNPRSQDTSSTPAFLMTTLGARRTVQPDHDEANTSHDP